MILNGTYPLAPRAGIVPLGDGAGEVQAVGDAVTRFGATSSARSIDGA
jgi:NADPH:quinone reductase-like Zn-dependent oxidoreductase